MILCIDIGNSQIHCGVFENNKLLIQFRYSSSEGLSSDQFGIFIKSIFIENNLDPKKLINITICSVVPELEYAVRSSCIKYFYIIPIFLNIGVKTGLKIKYSNPSEVGSDRIATAIGGNKLYPNDNIIIVDMGTATTIDLVTSEKEYLGGAIIPGLKTSIKALYNNTSKLPNIEIDKPKIRLGKSTKENIQIGLYYGHLGAIKEIIKHLIKCSSIESFKIIATGGFSKIYLDDSLFEKFHSDLAFIGLLKVTELNYCNETPKKI